MNPEPGSIYSKKELRLMRRWQREKDIVLAPLARATRQLGISANAISVVSAFVVVAGLVGAARFNQPGFFLWALWVHVFLDGLDGTVARLSPEVNQKPYYDTAADFVGIIATAVALGIFLPFPPLVLLFAVMAWGAVLLLAIHRTKQGNPYTWLIRPRLPLYFFATIDLIYSTAYTYLVLAVTLALFIVFIATGVKALTQKPHSSSAPSR